MTHNLEQISGEYSTFAVLESGRVTLLQYVVKCAELPLCKSYKTTAER